MCYNTHSTEALNEAQMAIRMQAGIVNNLSSKDTCTEFLSLG